MQEALDSYFILMCLSYLLGDKESKRKQKSPGTAAAAQVVVIRELKWDHQVCTINFMISARLAQGHLAPICKSFKNAVNDLINAHFQIKASYPINAPSTCKNFLDAPL